MLCVKFTDGFPNQAPYGAKQATAPSKSSITDVRAGAAHVELLSLIALASQQEADGGARSEAVEDQALPTAVPGPLDHIQVRTAHCISVSARKGTENRRPPPGRSVQAQPRKLSRT